MRLLERSSLSNSQRSSASSTAIPLEKSEEHTNDSLRSAVSTNTTASNHGNGGFLFFSKAIVGVDDHSSRVKFILPDEKLQKDTTTSLSEDPFEFDEATAAAYWYSPQELKEIKLGCAQEVVALRHTEQVRLQQQNQQVLCMENDEEALNCLQGSTPAPTPLDKILEACQTTAPAPTPAVVRERLTVLSRVLGIEHLVCPKFAASRCARRQALWAAVQKQQYRTTAEARPFLICRASEQWSLPGRRFAEWMARAVASSEDGLDWDDKNNGTNSTVQ